LPRSGITIENQYAATNDATFSGLWPRRSKSFVVIGSRWPASLCTSSSWRRSGLSRGEPRHHRHVAGGEL